MIVEFLRDEIVVLRFTVKIVDGTGFLVDFITVAVAFFDGFNVVTGLLVAFVAPVDDDNATVETDVRLNACAETGFWLKPRSAS